MSNSTFDLSRYNFLKEIAWLRQSLLGNSLYSYVLALAVFALVWFLLAMLGHHVKRQLEAVAAGSEAQARKVELCRFFSNLIKSIAPAVLPLLALYLATRRLSLAPGLDRSLRYVTLIIMTWQTIKLLCDVVAFLISRSRLVTPNQDPAAANTRKNLITLAQVSLWIGGVLFILDNFGINVSTFVAGLGISGVAIALASQAILGDTFSGFAIALDKPFQVEDFIIVDNFMGTVEHIGLKTTRVRSLSGELLIFSNSDLTKSRIKNYKKMYERRINFQLGVEYSTPLEQLQAIPRLIKDAIEATPTTRFDRAHFFKYGDYALIFDIVYHVSVPDYNSYMDAQESINLKIFESFQNREIAFAFPTQTIHLAQQGEAQQAMAAPLAQKR